MKRFHRTLGTLAVLGLLTATAGCYHATVDTGATPSAQSIEMPWAHGFVYGLVPPSTVDAASECSNGVARVETKLSFLNMLASQLTFGLYAPMTIEVTCAASRTTDQDDGAQAMTVPEDATEAELHQAFNEAAERAGETGQPVDVSFHALR